ncbi:MAG: SMP-30/gluconolactonase/LRE family protein [Pseudomonadota bacterium]
MKRILAVVAGLLLLVAAYLLFWPVAVDPVAWQAPKDAGYIDPYASNNLLRPATAIDLGEFEGPEDAALGTDGLIYATTKNGAILQIRNRAVTEFARVEGRALGIETDRDGSFVIANAYVGLQRISSDGSVTTLLDAVEGGPLVYANSLAIAPDGMIYFSQSSNKFGPGEFGGTYDASLLDILEHGGHGSVFAFDPQTRDVARIMSGLNYANGVAVSDAGDFLVVAETGHYRVLKHWLNGERRGETEILLDNLPGFPDNVKNGQNGRFWIGFAAPRNAIIDKWSDKPALRRMIQRLPAAVRPKAEPLSHVIAINGDGDVLMNMHDPSARFPTITGVVETRDALYLTTLFGNMLPRLAKGDIGR